jgi:hypothetical protein
VAEAAGARGERGAQAAVGEGARRRRRKQRGRRGGGCGASRRTTGRSQGVGAAEEAVAEAKAPCGQRLATDGGRLRGVCGGEGGRRAEAKAARRAVDLARRAGERGGGRRHGHRASTAKHGGCGGTACGVLVSASRAHGEGWGSSGAPRCRPRARRRRRAGQARRRPASEKERLTRRRTAGEAAKGGTGWKWIRRDHKQRNCSQARAEAGAVLFFLLLSIRKRAWGCGQIREADSL